MSKVILMGRLTRDPEIRYSQGNDQMAIAIDYMLRFIIFQEENMNNLCVIRRGILIVNLG